MNDQQSTFSPSTQFLGLVCWLVVVFIAAGIGAFASVNAGPFYAQLARPSWAPPGWLFGPVWTALYTLMGIAAWLVWRVRGFAQASPALWLFLGQLAVNSLWSWLFFFWHQGMLAFVEVLLLWALILATVVSFWRIRKLSAALLIPYFLWVTFASLLTFSVWRQNPHVLG
jgi:tryptophan-rich sensory protein